MTTRNRILIKSLIFCLPLAAGPVLVSPAQADPAIVDYVCEPPLPKDGHMTIDWNAGKNVVLLRFPPNKAATKLAFATSDFNFKYQKGKLVVYGKGDKELSLEMPKNPLRICTRTGAFREQHPAPDQKPQPVDPNAPPPEPQTQPPPDNAGNQGLFGNQ